ncbi:MAG TPA: hypothetical protein VLW44_09365 [Streptosporangiaceae bacterium]|nr:hypothetical protein [Streptosporangiaceae bacterium]
MALPIPSAAVALPGLARPGKNFEPFNDAPLSHKDDSAAEVYSMPGGCSNVAEKCDLHQNRIIVACHGDGERAAVTVVPHDPPAPAAGRALAQAAERAPSAWG